jgi:hypothetical protein
MLDLLAAAPRVDTPEPLYGAAEGNVKWLKPPAGRNLCTLCVRAIHGKEGGPTPLAATARRKGPNEELLLCPEHAIVMRELDDKAEAERKARAKAAGERPAARRTSGKKHREHA